jgi:hypothetical protein
VPLIRPIQHGDERTGIEQDIAADCQASLPPVSLSNHPRRGIARDRAAV